MTFDFQLAINWVAFGLLAYFTLRNRKDIRMAATQADLNASFVKLGNRLTNVLEDLKAKENPTPADFDAAIATVNGFIATLDAADPNPDNNDAPETPTEPAA